MKIRRGVNIIQQFKGHWLIKRKRKIFKTKAEEVLLAKGFHIYDAKDIIRPAVIEEPYEPRKDDEEEVVPEAMPPCYIFKNSFVPIEAMEQCQLITNSVVFDSLPKSYLSKVQDPTEEDEKVFADIIMASHILDAKQDKLPHVLDSMNFPGYRPPRKYGIVLEKRISSLFYRMLLHIDRLHPESERKHILEDLHIKVTMPHSGKLMRMEHDAMLMLGCKTPLPPVASPEEVQALAGTPLPDLYPLSPFIHSRTPDTYDPSDEFAIASGTLAPHTVFVGHLVYIFHHMTPEAFSAMSLLHAFSHAVSYARQRNKGVTGDLEEPITINVAHTNGQYFHFGRFQLNTLDCNSNTRNFFWHEPWTAMYDTVGFDVAKPSIHKLNARPLALLKAIF